MEAAVGAATWPVGAHVCKGHMPARIAKPTNTKGNELRSHQTAAENRPDRLRRLHRGNPAGSQGGRIPARNLLYRSVSHRVLKAPGRGAEDSLVPKMAQEVDLQTFTSLGAGDLLFVDSTHAVRPGGEVNRIILDVLPRMFAGCVVHFHDISFPYDYQPSVLSTLFFSNESTLLHAFLVNNSRCRIAVSLSMLHYACPEQMQQLLPNYRPAVLDGGLYTNASQEGHFPSSTYLAMT